MNIKEFFKLSLPVFVLFVIFNLLADWGVLQITSIAGKHIGVGVFDIFSILRELKCSSIDPSSICIYDSAIEFVTSLLNIMWQYFLACLVMFGVGKIRKE